MKEEKINIDDLIDNSFDGLKEDCLNILTCSSDFSNTVNDSWNLLYQEAAIVNEDSLIGLQNFANVSGFSSLDENFSLNTSDLFFDSSLLEPVNSLIADQKDKLLNKEAYDLDSISNSFDLFETNLQLDGFDTKLNAVWDEFDHLTIDGVSSDLNLSDSVVFSTANLLDSNYIGDGILTEFQNTVNDLSLNVSNYVDQFYSFEHEKLLHVLASSKNVVASEFGKIERLYDSINKKIDLNSLKEEYFNLYSLLDIDCEDAILQAIRQNLYDLTNKIYSEYERIRENFEKFRWLFLKPFLNTEIVRNIRKGFRQIFGFIFKNLDDESHADGLVEQQLIINTSNQTLIRNGHSIKKLFITNT